MRPFERSAYQVRQRQQRARKFVSRNISELRKPELFARKIRTLFGFHALNTFRFVCALPIALIIAFGMRLVSPIVVVRVGSINASRIGHLGFDPEMQLAEREIGIGVPDRPVFDIFYKWTGPLPIANHQMLVMWRRSLRLWPAWPWEHVDTVSRLMPWGDRHMIPARKGDPDVADLQQEDVHAALRRTAPHVWFTDAEIGRGESELRSVGLDPNREHVCLLVRDDAYLGGLQGGGFADHDFRNADVSTYEPAIRLLTSRGYYVFRMGVGGRARLDLDDPLFVDYAFSGFRSELLDLSLSARCRMFISTSTGLDAVAKTFRRPLVITNLAQLGDTHLTMGVHFIPKHVVSLESGERIPVSEQYMRGLHECRVASDYENLGVGFEDNSPAEILSVVDEVDRRLDGDWTETEADRSLQEQFLSLVPRRFKQGGVTGRIGAAFLRENEEWTH